MNQNFSKAYLEGVRKVKYSKQELETFFTRVYSEMYGEIHRYIIRITKDNRIIEDIVQETFFEAYKKINLLIEHENYRGWIYKTARYKALKLSNRIHNWDGKQVAMMNAEIQEIGKQDEYDCVTFADYKEILTNKEFDLLMKHYVEGFTLVEIANQEHINVGASKMRMNRIIKKLRRKTQR